MSGLSGKGHPQLALLRPFGSSDATSPILREVVGAVVVTGKKERPGRAGPFRIQQ